MNCPGCSQAVPRGARFCPACGAPQPAAHPASRAGGARCARCREELPRDARFCPRCGESARVEEPAVALAAAGASHAEPASQALPASLQRLVPRQYAEQLLASRGRRSGERRVVTILFSDMKDSSRMAETRDPEEVMEIMNGALAAMLEPVVAWEGTLARLMGDAILCFFGAPIAHENDPERACRCALDLLRSARAYAGRLERERGLSGFQVRVGINTGLVVVGEVGDDLRVEYTAMGDAVNLAARMETMAEPGTVLITENTWRLVRDTMETRSLGPAEVRGRAEPVCVHRLLGVRHRSGFHRLAERSRQSALVGRERELAEMNGALDALREGQGSCLLLSGEPGTGKSRLLAEVRARSQEWCAWHETSGLAHGSAVSYGVARRLLESLLGAPPPAPAGEVRQALERTFVRLRERMREGGGTEPADLAGIATDLARLLDLPAETGGEEAPEPPRSLRRRLETAFVGTIAALAGDRPLVLSCEDLQWGDPSSMELLEGLPRLTRDLPIVLVLVLRPEDGAGVAVQRRFASRGEARWRVIELGPLDPEASRAFARNLLGEHEVPEAALAPILAAAEGNALFLEEMIEALRESLPPGGAGGGHAGPSAKGMLVVPHSLQGAVTARLDRLHPDERLLLQTASVIGRNFDARALAHLLDLPAETGELPGRLRSLRARGILKRGPGPGLHAYRHALAAEVAYETLLVADRRRLHGRLARWIEAQRPGRAGAALPATLAYLYERAECWEKAFAWSMRAAHEELRLSAAQEAIEHYRRALRLSSVAAGPRGGSPAWQPAPDDLCLLYENLAEAYYWIGGYAQAVEHLRQTLALVPNATRRAALHRKCGDAFEKWGRLEEARACFEAGMAEMGPHIETAEAARIFTGLSRVCHRCGDLETAHEVAQLALELLEKDGDPRSIADACGVLGTVLAARGEATAALTHQLRCLALREALGEPFGLAAAHNNVALTYRKLGAPGKACEHLQQGAKLFQKLGNAHGVARAWDNLSSVYLEQGDLERSQEYMVKAVTLLGDLSVKDSREVDATPWQSGAW